MHVERRYRFSLHKTRSGDWTPCTYRILTPAEIHQRRDTLRVAADEGRLGVFRAVAAWMMIEELSRRARRNNEFRRQDPLKPYSSRHPEREYLPAAPTCSLSRSPFIHYGHGHGSKKPARIPCHYREDTGYRLPGVTSSALTLMVCPRRTGCYTPYTKVNDCPHPGSRHGWRS